MAQEFKIIGKLSDEELAVARKASLSCNPLPVKKTDDQKSRNIAMNEFLKIEKERYNSQKSMVSEWVVIHPRFATDINMMRDSVDELHRFVVGRLQDLPVDVVEQAHVINDIEQKIDDYNDTIEDKMYELEVRDVEECRSEVLLRRKNRDETRAKVFADRVEAASVKKQEIELAKEVEELRKEREAKEQEEAQKELKKQAEKKQKALDTCISDNEMILNINGVNSNLLSFSSRFADLVRTKKMTRAKLAKTKSGALVIVCTKPVADEQENVRISLRGCKYSCAIVSNTFCRYIRNVYDCNETDEYHFDIKYVAYADDIKIKIEGLFHS